MEAALLALLGKRWQDVTEADYRKLLKELKFSPRIENFAVATAT